MNALVVLGWQSQKGSQPRPKCLYCGLDGAAAQAAADKAAKDGGYVKLAKIVNPTNLIPLPLTPQKTIATGAPKPVERKPAVIPAIQPPVPFIKANEDFLAKQRAERLKPTPAAATAKAAETVTTETK